MRRTALICSLLLCLSGSSFAATAEELWQNYQQQPAVVSTTPTKPATASKADVPAKDAAAESAAGVAPEAAPATTEQTETAKTEALTKVTEAKAATADAKTAKQAAVTEAPKTATEPNAAETTEAVVNETPANATEAKTVAAETAASATNATKTPVVGNKPVAPADKPKPKPKLNLVGKPPLPRQFMRTPQVNDFTVVSSEAGGYSMAVPKAFGKNPLADLPQAEGAMLVRTASNILMLAATMLDAADTASFKATEALPVYENAKVYWQWQHGNQLIWTCRLSAHNDYHGNKLLLTAEAQQNGKTYQLLYVMPAAQADTYLPQAIYSLDSFKLNQP
ncbi:hypothetical protein [Phascolarctobacterium succinatutens]|uniref:hypothetical protein n=1 Tax=Phascolarctobacterium succinatutens TaxID=626940 RepID=UPI0026F060EE|nr:hypothetical protein [Phascolarctobacterium succinatutens]